MKLLQYLLSIILFFGIIRNSFSQPNSIKAFTGKAFSVNFAVQPYSFYHSKRVNQFNYSFDFSLSKKIGKGFYPTIGYTRIQNFNNINSLFRNTFNTNVLTSSFMLQKKFITLKSYYKYPHCYAKFLSLLFGPEYNYALNQKNNYNGEIALKLGLSLFTIHSGVKSRVIIWDIFYRKGFTPILSNNLGDFKRDEFGIQLRILKRQTYSFY